MRKFDRTSRENTVFIEKYTNLPMPNYAFLPGINQHPNKNPQQRHILEIQDVKEPINELNWQNTQAYLYAIDLFNRGYYWEVHEVLENLWIKAGKETEPATFLKGIIQLAVALLKVKTGNFYGGKRLYNKAMIHLQRKERIYLGINLKKIVDECEKYIRKEIDEPPVIMLIA
ncbi:MAG: DUF309 domain-containing protein [Bacteroidales bacterium]|nr:DUF309 domain-containing protein [Bacteroidales bacterium]